MKILLANPRGFCAGVERAVDIVHRALEIFGAPIYVRHEVVHNKYVVENLIKKGVVFVEDIHEIPDKSIVIFSAHGVSKKIEEEANQRELKVFDASCPLVKKVHMEVTLYAKKNIECILIGHHGHPEVEGTIGQYDIKHGGAIYLIQTIEEINKLIVKNPNQLAYVTQTTLSINDTKLIIDALKKRFPLIKSPIKDDICYATQNRQEAVKKLSEQCDIVLVIGSINSSNSNRLKELAEKSGSTSYLIDNKNDIKKHWFKNKINIGITAGASAPEILVKEVIELLKKMGASAPQNISGIPENITFSLPKELRLEYIE